MTDKEKQPDGTEDRGKLVEDRTPVSRRQFLKIAGIAGATVGVGAGIGGLLTACGEGEETTTTAGPTTTAAPNHHTAS